MKNFLKYTLATITGIIIASILFFIHGKAGEVGERQFTGTVADGRLTGVSADGIQQAFDEHSGSPARQNGSERSC